MKPAQYAGMSEKEMTVEQAAKRLQVSPRHLRELIKSGVLPAFNVGLPGGRPRYRIEHADLARFIENQRTKRAEPAEQTKPRPLPPVGSFV